MTIRTLFRGALLGAFVGTAALLAPAASADAQVMPRGEREAPAAPDLGVQWTETDAGVVVESVNDDGIGAMLGLEPGDRLVSLNGVDVTNLRQVRRALAAGDGNLDIRIETAHGEKHFQLRSARESMRHGMGSGPDGEWQEGPGPIPGDGDGNEELRRMVELLQKEMERLRRQLEEGERPRPDGPRVIPPTRSDGEFRMSEEQRRLMEELMRRFRGDGEEGGFRFRVEPRGDDDEEHFEFRGAPRGGDDEEHFEFRMAPHGDHEEDREFHFRMAPQGDHDQEHFQFRMAPRGDHEEERNFRFRVEPQGDHHREYLWVPGGDDRRPWRVEPRQGRRGTWSARPGGHGDFTRPRVRVLVIPIDGMGGFDRAPRGHGRCPTCGCGGDGPERILRVRRMSDGRNPEGMLRVLRQMDGQGNPERILRVLRQMDGPERPERILRVLRQMDGPDSPERIFRVLRESDGPQRPERRERRERRDHDRHGERWF